MAAIVFVLIFILGISTELFIRPGVIVPGDTAATDPHVTEQISMAIITPVMAVFFSQVAGLFVLNTQLFSIVAFVMLALDVFMIYLASQVFDRESILTRWR
ncbi:MAG: hypothetical protein AB9897_01890 [Anaerolineaceae bacterium]